MFTHNAAKSVDNLSSLSPIARGELPFHSSNRHGSVHHMPPTRRGSTASSIHSVGGTLDSAPSGWAASLYESNQNAISTLLQPPIVRTGLQPHTSAPPSSAHKPPTARDIPPVALTNITHVDVDEFKPYLSQVGALYEQLRRIKENDDDANISQRMGMQDEQADTSGSDMYLRPGSGPRPTRKGSTASLTSLNSNEGASPTIRRPSAGFARRSFQGPPPLSTIPTVYFDEGFHLENPRTFDVVSERSEVIRPPTVENDEKGIINGSAAAPRKALATNAILQEKLSWYMDTIEVHLINSISTASTTFFTALGSLKELHSEAADSVQRIKTLRTELEALDEEIAAKGLQIVHKRRRRENLQQLNDAVLQLRQIANGVMDCEALVEEGEVDKALAGIDSLEKLIAGERDADADEPDFQLRDLRSASALQGVNADLMTLRSRIGKAYESNFQNILMRDLRCHSESVSPQEILLRWTNAATRARGGHARSPSVFPAYLAATEELKAQLFPSMVGLYRAKHIAAATIAYREAVLREIRNLIRRPLPSSTDDDNESMMSVSTASGGRHLSNQEKSSILARNLRALDPEDGEELLIKIYVGVTETLRRLTTQVKVLLETTSSLTDTPRGDGLMSPPLRSPIASPRPDRFPTNPLNSTFEAQEELHKNLDIPNLLGQAVDVAIEKIVKVLKVRAEQTAQLPLTHFLRYFTLNLYFANECESISGRSGTSLKTVVNGHIKDFVQRNRDAEMQKLAQGMESDQWNAKDFSEQNADLLNMLLGSSTQDALEWTESNKIYVPYSEADNEDGEAAAAETNGTSKEKIRTATIDSETFMLPKSAILCLEGIAKFSHLITGIPSMSLDIATSLIAYLQLFNSRCTQLILGAGATRSAGLRNITTKHLALASQALSFVATIIPHIREFVRRHAGSGANVSNLMGEFDKIRRLLQEHQDSIYQKLVDIMGGRATIHSRNMKTIDWDSAETKGVHPYMETLAKETSTLHRVLTKHLPETSIQMIMLPVFSSYKDQLGSTLQEANPKTEVGIQSMLNDLDFLSTKLGKLDGFGDTGEFLEKIVKAKKVEPKKVEAEEPPANDGSTEPKDNEPRENGEQGSDEPAKEDEKK